MESNVVEILYTDACPFWKRTLEIINEVMKELHISANIRKIEIIGEDEAKRYRFPGSPTVRINGIDIDPSTKDTSGYIGCRIYMHGGRTYEYPPREMIASAFKRFMKK